MGAQVKKFDELMLEAVDEGLVVLGESSKNVIYWHLRRRGDVKRHEIPVKLQEFAASLERLFGDGSKILEAAILRRLYSKIGLEFIERPDRDFLDHIREVSEYVESSD